jgi:hypothetical protein
VIAGQNPEAPGVQRQLLDAELGTEVGHQVARGIQRRKIEGHVVLFG